MKALGIEAHAPRKIEFKRVGKKRDPQPIISPYLPGYIFADIPDGLYQAASSCNGINRKMLPIPEHEVRTQVLRFLDMVSRENEEAERIMANNDRAAMVQYTAGQALEVLSGPFMDVAVRFVRMVSEQGSMHPMIEAEADIFGRLTKVKIDPVDVKESV